ncbi:hypothetical protein [Mycolicibacterium sp.]|uniref:lipopolysaccharide biosynthesis protein n=1 Tax=Mycolicibacterium sp. TaxID=2320850 RepID=UPI001A35A7C1|nr:hypothetical protein [Mycolicibacterium sp.]MBJ7339091.1 hypothetical protein [Mycolicibacterium sp.]
MWLYGGRGVGLLWTLAIIAKLGIADYGLYGLGFALASIIGPPLDNSFAVRAIRESERRFLAERTTRFLVGLSLMFCGAALLDVNYVAWFGLFVAGGEIAFKSYQSQAARDGHPDRVSRMDSTRQGISVAMACAYLFGTEHPTLLGATLLYCAPYLVIAVLAGQRVWGHRPGIPGPPRLMAALTGEMLGTAVYLQGDVLLLGYLTDTTIVGYYTIAITVGIALSSLGTSFGMTYHEPLRTSGGDLATGPPLRHTVLFGVAAGALMAIIGVGLLVSPAPTELAIAMIIMSAWCAIRTVVSIFQVILYTQRRDLVRLSAALGLVPFKLLLVAALASAGAVGASVASVITDAILLLVYSVALYRNPAARRHIEPTVPNDKADE